MTTLTVLHECINHPTRRKRRHKVGSSLTWVSGNEEWRCWASRLWMRRGICWMKSSCHWHRWALDSRSRSVTSSAFVTILIPTLIHLWICERRLLASTRFMIVLEISSMSLLRMRRLHWTSERYKSSSYTNVIFEWVVHISVSISELWRRQAIARSNPSCRSTMRWGVSCRDRLLLRSTSWHSTLGWLSSTSMKLWSTSLIIEAEGGWSSDSRTKSQLLSEFEASTSLEP